MTTVLRIATLLLLICSLTACAGSLESNRPSPAAGYSYKYKDFDLYYAWNTQESGPDLVIKGLIKNVRYASVENLQVSATLLDKNKQPLRRAMTFISSPNIRIDELRDFQITLPNAKATPGTMLQFEVDYNVSEGSNAYRWHGTFTVNAQTGVSVAPGRAPGDDW